MVRFKALKKRILCLFLALSLSVGVIHIQEPVQSYAAIPVVAAGALATLLVSLLSAAGYSMEPEDIKDISQVNDDLKTGLVTASSLPFLMQANQVVPLVDSFGNKFLGFVSNNFFFENSVSYDDIDDYFRAMDPARSEKVVNDSEFLFAYPYNPETEFYPTPSVVQQVDRELTAHGVGFKSIISRLTDLGINSYQNVVAALKDIKDATSVILTSDAAKNLFSTLLTFLQAAAQQVALDNNAGLPADGIININDGIARLKDIPEFYDYFIEDDVNHRFDDVNRLFIYKDYNNVSCGLYGGEYEFFFNNPLNGSSDVNIQVLNNPNYSGLKSIYFNCLDSSGNPVWLSECFRGVNNYIYTDGNYRTFESYDKTLSFERTYTNYSYSFVAYPYIIVLPHTTVLDPSFEQIKDLVIDVDGNNPSIVAGDFNLRDLFNDNVDTSNPPLIYDGVPDPVVLEDSGDLDGFVNTVANGRDIPISPGAQPLDPDADPWNIDNLADLLTLVNTGISTSNDILELIWERLKRVFIDDIDGKNVLERVDDNLQSLTRIAEKAEADAKDDPLTKAISDALGVSSEDDNPDKEPSGSVFDLFKLIYLLLLLLIYILILMEKCMMLVIKVFHTPATTGFLPEGMISGLDWIKSLNIPVFNISVWDFCFVLIYVILVFHVIAIIKRHVDDIHV